VFSSALSIEISSTFACVYRPGRENARPSSP
jgi:hypothetical protein